MTARYKSHAVKEYIEELDRLERTAILSAADVTDDMTEIDKWLSDGFSTSIVLHCTQDAIDSIKTQLMELRFEELLFLKYVTHIDIEIPGQQRVIDAIREPEPEKNRNRILIQDGMSFTDWTVWSEDGKVEQKDGSYKDYELAIAYNNDAEERELIRQKGVLYSFFKTDIKMPFPFLVHGTFDLTSDRNGLIKQGSSSDNNVLLVNKLVDFIARKAADIALESNCCNYDALKFMLPARDIHILDDEYGFSDKLKDRIKDYAVLPTIGGRYISINDNPHYSPNRFDEVLMPERFDSLLQHSDDAAIINYLRSVQIGFYTCYEATELINADADYYTQKGLNAKIIALFFNEFAYRPVVPMLLIDSKGQRITEKELTVFNNPDRHFDLPIWGEMRFLNSNMEKDLMRVWNIKSRGLMDWLSGYGGAEYSFDRVLGVLIRQSNESKERTVDLLKWLYREWKGNNQQFDSAFTNINIRTLSRDGEIVFCSKCYLGREYGNDIGERIVSCLDKSIFLADYSTLGFKSEDIEVVKTFFTQLGVKRYPVIECGVELTGTTDEGEYKRYNSEKYDKIYADGDQFSYYDFFCTPSSNHIKVSDIPGIKSILMNADFIDILYWVFNDYNLYAHITSENEIDDESCMIGLPYYKKNTRRAEKGYMRSWLRKQFAEVAWLPTVNGRKIDCNKCTLTNNMLSPVVEMVDLDYDKISNIFGRSMKKDIDALLDRLGVAEDIDKLPKNIIYEILLRLPEIDIDKTIGSKIYTKLNAKFDSAGVSKIIERNAAYDLFLREGKVLANIGGKLEYLPIGEVFYVDKKIYSDDILKEYPLLVLNRRAGDDKIKKLFGVQSIKKIGEINVDARLHRLNDDFQILYQKLLPYIYAKRIEVDNNNRELNALKDNKIVLAESVVTSHTVNGVSRGGFLRDYEVIYSKDDKIAYIKVPRDATSLSEVRKEISFAVAEVITSIIDVVGDKDAFINLFQCESVREVERYFKANGDEDLTLVNFSKEKFGNITDYCYEFWNAISQVVKVEITECKEKYAHLLPDNFDYRLITDAQVKWIISLFRAIKIDVDAYNMKALVQVRLVNYYAQKFRELKQKYRKQYLHLQLSRLIEQGGTVAEFEAIKTKYDFFENTIPNSVNVDLSQLFEQSFDVSLSQLDLENENWESLLGQLKNPESGGIIDNPNYNHEDVSSQIKLDYRQINDNIANETNGESLIPEIGLPDSTNYGSGHTSNGGGSYDKRTDERKDLDGFIAESKVYNTLLKKWGEFGSVVWVSGNGERAGATIHGNDSCGYDMRYTDAEGNIHYVEVKGTASNNLEFELSRNEFNFAQENKERYELWFVFIKDGEVQKPYELGRIFVFDEGEDFIYNHRFSIEQSRFRFRAKIIKI